MKFNNFLKLVVISKKGGIRTENKEIFLTIFPIKTSSNQKLLNYRKIILPYQE